MNPVVVWLESAESEWWRRSHGCRPVATWLASFEGQPRAVLRGRPMRGPVDPECDPCGGAVTSTPPLGPQIDVQRRAAAYPYMSVGETVSGDLGASQGRR